MRFRTAIMTIILSLLFASILPAAQRGIKVTAKTPSGKAIPLYSGSYALVIGNGDYTKGWDPLPGAIRDVKDVARALKENGFQVILRTNLSRNTFNRAFADFFYKYGRTKTNRLLFYYAGHGYTQRMYTDEDQGYLVMVDAPVPEKDPVGFEVASVDMQVVVTQAKKVKARHVLFMFDSCFSGAILNLRERIVPEAISDSVSLPVRQFITAGRANEPVPDHSIFKQAFLDLLEGRDKEPIPDGYITGEELGLYLKNKVPKYNAAQHPQYGKINDIRLDKGDFVFALNIPSKPKPSAPVQSSGIRDYDKIIQERQADRKTWDAWQKRLETDMVKVERYDKSSALNEKEKAEAWAGLLASYGADNPYTAKDDELRNKARERNRYWKGYKESGKLFVDAAPTGAKIRILNIGPKFYQGIELRPGRYHVETSKQGYETKKQWVILETGEDKRLGVMLKQLLASEVIQHRPGDAAGGRISELTVQERPDAGTQLRIGTDKPAESEITLEANVLSINLKDVSASPQELKALETQLSAGVIQEIRAFYAPRDRSVLLKVSLRALTPYHVSRDGNLLIVNFGPLPSGFSQPGPQSAAQPISQKPKNTTTVKPLQTQHSTSSGLYDVAKASKQEETRDELFESGSKNYAGQKISFDFVDTDIRNILKFLSEVANLNIVWGNDVEGKISMRLDNVAWDQALEMVLKPNGLTYQIEDEVLWVIPRSKLVDIKFAEKKQKNALMATKRLQGVFEAKVMEFIVVKHRPVADIFKMLLDDLTTTPSTPNILGVEGAKNNEKKGREDGNKVEINTLDLYLSYDSGTSMIIANGLQPKVDKVKELVRVLDVPEKQAMIKARTIEISDGYCPCSQYRMEIFGRQPLDQQLGKLVPNIVLALG